MTDNFDPQFEKLRRRADASLFVLTRAFAMRAVGHTTAMLKGAADVENSICIVHSQLFASGLERQYPSVRFISIDDAARRLVGMRSGPVLIDHAALLKLLADAVAYHDALEESFRNLAEAK